MLVLTCYNENNYEIDHTDIICIHGDANVLRIEEGWYPSGDISMISFSHRFKSILYWSYRESLLQNLLY